MLEAAREGRGAKGAPQEAAGEAAEEEPAGEGPEAAREEGVAEEAPKEALEELALEAPEEAAGDLPKGALQEATADAAEVPEEEPEATEEAAEEAPETGEDAEGAPEESPGAMPVVAHFATPKAVPEASPEAAPEGPQRGVPKRAPEVSPEAPPKAVREAPPESAVEPWFASALAAAQGEAPEGQPEEGPEGRHEQGAVALSVEAGAGSGIGAKGAEEGGVLGSAECGDHDIGGGEALAVDSPRLGIHEETFSDWDSSEGEGLPPADGETGDNAKLLLGTSEEPRQLSMSQVRSIPRIGGRLLSIGSASHGVSGCVACKHHGTPRGCRDGVLCLDCHFPHEEMTRSERRRRVSRRGKARAELAALIAQLKTDDSEESQEAVRMAQTLFAEQVYGAITNGQRGPKPEALPQPSFGARTSIGSAEDTSLASMPLTVEHTCSDEQACTVKAWNGDASPKSMPAKLHWDGTGGTLSIEF